MAFLPLQLLHQHRTEPQLRSAMVGPKTTPRIIIHGGAGNITRQNLQHGAYEAYRASLLSILEQSYELLNEPGATALDVATHAVSLLEDDPLFNAGHGAVYTRSGTHELEASVMVSQGHRKRGVGAMLISRVKSPIKFVREMLIQGEQIDGGGAGGHSQLAGDTVHELAKQWGLELCEPSYYWTKRRWDEHRRGLGLSTDDETYQKKKNEANSAIVGDDSSQKQSNSFYAGPKDPSWDGHEYLPQGTVGCVVLDSEGTLCAATSTGGLTNKLPGRIGDTPTIGAGFFADQWTEEKPFAPAMIYRKQHHLPGPSLRGHIGSIIQDCLPISPLYTPLATEPGAVEEKFDAVSEKSTSYRHGVAMSGTGNGDSFLRVSAARTAAALVRFTFPQLSLASAVSRVAGPDGLLQESAGDRFGKTGEGEGGIIGIEYRFGEGKVVADLNCGGMLRAWVDDDGNHRMMALKDEW